MLSIYYTPRRLEVPEEPRILRLITRVTKRSLVCLKVIIQKDKYNYGNLCGKPTLVCK